MDIQAPADQTTSRALERLRETVPLQELRRTRIAELLRRHSTRIEADPAGAPILRGQIIAYAPSAQTMSAARAAGLELISERELPGLGMRLAIFRVPKGQSTAEALLRLRAVDEQTVFDFNHLFAPVGKVAPDGKPANEPGPQHARPSDNSYAAANRSTDRAAAGNHRIGLIDGGVDTRHAALRGIAVQRWGCHRRVAASAHGTAIASLLAGKAAQFQGALPGARLYAADIYCGQATGGAVDALVGAFDWLAQERVAVVNVSLVGPANRILERAVHGMIAHGHIIVAAVGNDGPAAPPLYPASYPGVVGVTAVDARRHALLEAAQGPQVFFAAPGTDMAAAGLNGYVTVRGTSFAAPIVAGLLAASLERPDTVQALQALQDLSGKAIDLGAPGKDSIYGHGLVGEPLRTPPERVRARPARHAD